MYLTAWLHNVCVRTDSTTSLDIHNVWEVTRSPQHSHMFMFISHMYLCSSCFSVVFSLKPNASAIYHMFCVVPVCTYVYWLALDPAGCYVHGILAGVH